MSKGLELERSLSEEYLRWLVQVIDGAMEHYILQNRNISMDGGRPFLALDQPSDINCLRESKQVYVWADFGFLPSLGCGSGGLGIPSNPTASL
jgi:hypothetical protein